MVYTLQVSTAQWSEEPAQIATLDEDVPLAPLPKTGEESRSYYLVAVISSLLFGLYIALHGRKGDSRRIAEWIYREIRTTVKSELPFRSLDDSFYDNRGEKTQGYFPS